jgi:hypothetical protein
MPTHPKEAQIASSPLLLQALSAAPGYILLRRSAAFVTLNSAQ